MRVAVAVIVGVILAVRMRAAVLVGVNPIRPVTVLREPGFITRITSPSDPRDRARPSVEIASPPERYRSLIN